MKQFFVKAKVLIQELINARYSQSQLFIKLDKKKDSTATNFKIKNYTKWILLLNILIKDEIQIKNINDIKSLKLTEKLDLKLCELFDTGEIKDIEETKYEIIKLEQELNNNSLSNSIISMDSSIDDSEEQTQNDLENFDKNKNGLTKSDEKEKGKTKAIKVINHNKDKINTNNLESIPKVMASISRPTDEKGGAIYDLQLLHGIGAKTAIVLYEKGVTLEGLFKEWTSLISKDPKNAILLNQKMDKPSDYTKTAWDSLDHWKRYSILDSNLKNKLDRETTQLCKIHKSTLIGLKYFHDITKKIPRDEIEKAELILTRVAHHMNKDLKIILCGSFRRGRDKSGDIDCCIFHPSIETQDDIKSNQYNILANFVEILINIDFVVDQLDMGLQKFMGLCIIKQNNKKQNITRRLDIRFMPYESYGSAILYFTGSANFNTDIRRIAVSKGYSLSEFGFKKKSDDILIPCATEQDVFTFLNIPYKTPKERDI